LENVRELVAEFKGRMNIEVRRQEKLGLVEKRNFRRRELPRKYIAKMLYGWNDKKFENKYLRKLERNWQNWKKKDKTIWEKELISSFGSRNLEGGVMSDM